MLFKAQSGKMLPAHFAIGLTALRRINGGKPHGQLLIRAWIATTGFDGVAIGDADDKAKKCRREQTQRTLRAM